MRSDLTPWTIPWRASPRIALVAGLIALAVAAGGVLISCSWRSCWHRTGAIVGSSDRLPLVGA